MRPAVIVIVIEWWRHRRARGRVRWYWNGVEVPVRRLSKRSYEAMPFTLHDTDPAATGAVTLEDAANVVVAEDSPIAWAVAPDGVVNLTADATGENLTVAPVGVGTATLTGTTTDTDGTVVTITDTVTVTGGEPTKGSIAWTPGTPAV